MKAIAFFSNKGGVGKTTLVYHVAWMFHRLGKRVLVADLDPQANLTAALLEDNRIEQLWAGAPPGSIFGAVAPLNERVGNALPPHVELVDGIGLLPGDLALSLFEDRLGRAWTACLDDDAASAEDAFKVTTALHRVVSVAAMEQRADVVLLDLGPSLGALNRAALVGSDAVVVPLATDFYSVRALRNLGLMLHESRAGWATRRERPQAFESSPLPLGAMQLLGYVVVQHAAKRAHEPAPAHQRWIERLAREFHEAVLGAAPPVGADAACLGQVRHFRSLLPLSLEARKPVFDLKAADGAVGSHAAAVQDAVVAFEALTRAIASGVGLSID